MTDLERSISGVKHNVDFMEELQIKESDSEVCGDYDFVYAWTNEDINGYLTAANIKPASGLSVLSSGDHPFNLVTLGAKHVDTFDSNYLTEYYALGFKRAMILKYNYNQFKRKMFGITYGFIPPEGVIELVKSLFPYMEKKHQIFFQELIDYIYNKKLPVKNIIDLLILGYDSRRWEYQPFGSNYFISEENYNTLRANLASTTITFSKIDALDLAKTFKGKKYDAIMLSNILDYFFRYSKTSWTYQVIFGYEKELEQLLNKDGVLFLYYVFETPARDGQVYPFNRINIIPEHLREEELIKFPNCYESDSAIVLKREGSKERTIKI